ncbi:MAG: hypothetical protein ABIB71_04110 [Candidatus Woesearchaeota archaeon]
MKGIVKIPADIVDIGCELMGAAKEQMVSGAKELKEEWKSLPRERKVRRFFLGCVSDLLWEEWKKPTS